MTEPESTDDLIRAGQLWPAAEVVGEQKTDHVTEPESTDDLIRAGRREAGEIAEEQRAEHMAQHDAVREVVSAHTVETSDSLARLGQAASAGQSQTTDALIREQGGSQVTAMVGVIAAVDRLRDAILATAATKEDVQAAEANADNGRRGLRRLTIAGITALVVLAGTNVVLNTRNGAEAKDAASSATLLLDCNTPSTSKVKHACYDRTQASSAAAVASVVGRQSTNAAIAVTAGLQCARQNPTLADIALRDCVLAKLKNAMP